MQGVGDPIILNATLINRETALRLVESGIDLIMVSFDGASRETFESIRVGANYETVIKNIGQLIKAEGCFPGSAVPVADTIPCDRNHMKKCMSASLFRRITGRELLEACLGSFSNQSYPGDSYEVIVVDDNPGDDTPSFLRDYAKEAPYLVFSLFLTGQCRHGCCV